MKLSINQSINQSWIYIAHKRKASNASNKFLKKIDHAVKEAVLENLYFQWCALNANKIDIVVYFSELVCQFFFLFVFKFTFLKFQPNLTSFCKIMPNYFEVHSTFCPYTV